MAKTVWRLRFESRSFRSQEYVTVVTFSITYNGGRSTQNSIGLIALKCGRIFLYNNDTVGRPGATYAVSLALLSALVLPSIGRGQSAPQYPLCQAWLKGPNGPAMTQAVALLGSLLPPAAGPISFTEQRQRDSAGFDQDYQIATIQNCDAPLAQRLQQGLSFGLANQRLPVQARVVHVPGPSATSAPPIRRENVDSSIPERLARAYRAAYGTAYERSDRTGLYGPYMVSLDSARWAARDQGGFDPRLVRTDRQVAAQAGLEHFQNLLNRYQGDTRKAALAHCAGAGRVERGMAIPNQCKRFLAEFERDSSSPLQDAPGAVRREESTEWPTAPARRLLRPRPAPLQQPQTAWPTLPPVRQDSSVAWPTEPQQALPGPLRAVGDIGRQVVGFVGTVVLWPFDMAKHIISGFGAPRDHGRIHLGVDIGAPIGTPIVAPASGWIEGRFGYAGISGYRLWVYHGKDQYGRTIETFYAHLNRTGPYAAGIRPGVFVRQGQVIGYVGMTGNARFLPISASHLHFQVRIDGRDVDPQRVFQSNLLVSLR